MVPFNTRITLRFTARRSVDTDPSITCATTTASALSVKVLNGTGADPEQIALLLAIANMTVVSAMRLQMLNTILCGDFSELLLLLNLHCLRCRRRGSLPGARRGLCFRGADGIFLPGRLVR